MFTNHLSHLRSAMLGVAFVAGATVSIPVLAADSDTPRRVVQYSDADFSSADSVAALYARLQRASRNVCEPLKRGDASSLLKYNNCYTKALADAVNTVNQQTLTALHNQPNTKSARTAARAKAERRS